MACEITFKDDMLHMNNFLFSRLIDFSIEIAEQTPAAGELAFVERMKLMQDEVFWPGRGIDIRKDFPAIAERKFWCRVFFDVARDFRPANRSSRASVLAGADDLRRLCGGTSI